MFNQKTKYRHICRLSITSAMLPEIFMQINRILTKLCRLNFKARGSSNASPCICLGLLVDGGYRGNPRPCPPTAAPSCEYRRLWICQSIKRTLIHYTGCRLPDVSNIIYASWCLTFTMARRPCTWLICAPAVATIVRLRLSARGHFLVRRTRTRFANSSFTVAGPAAWNSPPAHIRTIDSHSAFCRHLKTYLFTVPDWLSLTVGLYLHMYT